MLHRPSLRVHVAGVGGVWGGLLGNGILEAETQRQPHRAPGPGAGLGEVGGGAQPRLTWQRG